MRIVPASPSDLDEAVTCLAAAFALDPITGFLLQAGSGYHERLTRFFSLLMRARFALDMPVFVAVDSAGVRGAAMGYSTVRTQWPGDLVEAWDRFERAVPGMSGRMATYDGVSNRYKPPEPHYYLGAIGTHPDFLRRGVGSRLLESFCERSASDPLSCGVYLETAQAANLAFYERAGFVTTGHGRLGDATLWCMYRAHGRR
ncbi:MAG: GNAT family N-acetyltransferase [Xanthomonadales bacterium]|nr:GNAT family N-acetyltransferase [Xanthomonadales bacterium]